MSEPPTLRAGRGAPGAQPGTVPTESQFTRNINAMNRLADKLDGFIGVSRRIYDATVALDGKLAANGEQLARVSEAHTAATESHIREMRAVARELRASTRALAHLTAALGGGAPKGKNPGIKKSQKSTGGATAMKRPRTARRRGETL